MNIQKLHQAVFALYPKAISVHGGDTESLRATDKEENDIVIDINAVLNWQDPNAYIAKRAAEYPPITDYLDGIVKNDQAQIDKYIADCQAVKQKYPKGA